MVKLPVNRRVLTQRLLLTALLFFVEYVNADANSAYKAGSDFADQIKRQGEDTLRNFKPDSELPNYTASPAESNYYGGISAAGDNGLSNAGVNNWANSEAGKAVNDSVLNNPKEPVSPDAPFIIAGKEAEANADSIVGNKDGQCQAQEVIRSEYTHYICERDLSVEQFCTRVASVQGHYIDHQENKNVVLNLSNARREGRRVRLDFSLPETGTVFHATVKAYYTAYPSHRGFFWTFSTLGGKTKTQSGEPAVSLGVAGYNVSAQENRVMYIDIDTAVRPELAADTLADKLRYGEVVLTLDVHMWANTKIWQPVVSWTENCPFSKAEGLIQKTECIEAGGNKTVHVEGKPYTIYQQCWAYKDTFMTQAADAGMCKAYMENPACTLAVRQCAFKSEEGVCLHENATYSCETTTSGKVMICGGDVFCLDGECDKAQHGQNNDFAHAVSQLAAVAAAGNDVSELNGVDVRAFTGQPRFCKKFAVGFSNCCKDSGWGNDIGLANCSNEEKALGKAKEKKLAVSIGEFCSKKVLGVCLEKKRSYCQFDSKLAQIVQQQGRAWQLGIGFGGAESPDCRGMTVEELQQVKFDRLDFSHFFDDLINNQKVPDNDALLDKVKEQINKQRKP